MTSRIPKGTKLNFQVDRKIVIPGGEWGTPREVMASLEPFKDDVDLLPNSRVRLSDDKTRLWITLPPQLLVEEGPNSSVVDVVVTGNFRVPEHSDRSIATQLLQFVRHQQSKDTFLNHTNLVMRINVPDDYMDDMEFDVAQESEDEMSETSVRARLLDRKRKAEMDSKDEEDTDSDDVEDITEQIQARHSAQRSAAQLAQQSEERLAAQLAQQSEERLAQRKAEQKAERLAQQQRAAKYQRSEPRLDGRPRRGQQHRTDELPVDLDGRVYVDQSTIPGAGQGLFAKVDFNEGDAVVWMGSPILVDQAFQKRAEAQGFPHDAFIHNEKRTGPLRQERGTLVMDRDFNDVNKRPLWYFINHGESEANLKFEYDPEQHTFEWIARRFIPQGDELFFNYTPGEKLTFSN